MTTTQATTGFPYANPPTNCDTCATPIDDVFFDMKTKMGPWANMCPSCALLGPGIGRCGGGLGQKWVKAANGRFYKVEG